MLFLPLLAAAAMATPLSQPQAEVEVANDTESTNHLPTHNIPKLTCTNQSKENCLSSQAHPDGPLSQAGCQITAASQCDTPLPAYITNKNTVKQLLTWVPPATCKQAFERCTSEIKVPYFNHVVCTQHLPLLCRESLDSEEREDINDALELLHSDLMGSLHFMYANVPFTRVEKFDQCVEKGHVLEKEQEKSNKRSESEQRGADLFFACLTEAKRP